IDDLDGNRARSCRDGHRADGGGGIRADVDREDLRCACGRLLFVDRQHGARRRRCRRDGCARTETLVELGRGDVDALEERLVVENDGDRHHADVVPPAQVRRQLGARVGDEPDHCCPATDTVLAAARNLYRIIVEPITAKRKSPTDGSGPQRFGRSASHHTSAEMIQTMHATWVPRSARRDLSALAPATARSIGKYAGKAARHAPAAAATPFPPRNPDPTGKMTPAMATGAG